MSTSTSTSTLDSLVAEFERRLGTVEKSSLEQWQFAYKKVIFAMGLKILEQFPRNALGPEPIAVGHSGGGGPAGGDPGHAAGPGPTKSPIKGRGPFADGGGPWGPIIHIAIAALELAPPPSS